MGVFDRLNDPDRLARSRMEAAQDASKRQFTPESEKVDSQGKPIPKRYKLYDRIAGRVSVGTMNVIIVAVAILLVAAIVIGVATGNPQ